MDPPTYARILHQVITELGADVPRELEEVSSAFAELSDVPLSRLTVEHYAFYVEYAAWLKQRLHAIITADRDLAGSFRVYCDRLHNNGADLERSETSENFGRALSAR